MCLIVFSCITCPMKTTCPNSDCKSSHIIKDGTFKRSSDSRTIQRYRCRRCGKRFSRATSTLEYRQKKRRVNFPLFKLLSSGVSGRRAAKILGIHQKTVARKLIYLGAKARVRQRGLLQRMKAAPLPEVQFDDLITSHHSKLKPLTVPVAVDARKRLILAVEVGQIPAFGHIAKRSIKKYGARKCEHKQTLHQLFSTLAPLSIQSFRSDEHHRYHRILKDHFPLAKYQQHKSQPATVVGQGEMKKGGFDPIFAINHTLAMLRANINRLFRRTWNTTKDPRRLKDHLDIYVWFHNREMLRINTT